MGARMLELYVVRENSSRVERVERDDPQGRNIIHKLASALMESSKVRYCKVDRVDRVANTRSKGSYR